MTGREWKPGDVALISYNYADGGVALRVEGCSTDGHSTKPHWHFANGSHGDGSAARAIRPLVVIDPENREQVKRFNRLQDDAYAARGIQVSPRTESESDVDYAVMQAALREFADPKPPKPDAPNGLGAVAEDADGKLWIRLHTHGDDCNDWYPVREAEYSSTDVLCSGKDGGMRRKWSELDIVKVLAEGVTA